VATWNLTLEEGNRRPQLRQWKFKCNSYGVKQRSSWPSYRKPRIPERKPKTVQERQHSNKRNMIESEERRRRNYEMRPVPMEIPVASKDGGRL
jgi:hypothetical protein